MTIRVTIRVCDHVKVIVVCLCVCQWADELVDKYTVVQSRELQTRRQFDECIGQFHWSLVSFIGHLMNVLQFRLSNC